MTTSTTPPTPSRSREAFEQLLEALGSDATLDEEAGTAFEIAARVEIPVEAKQKLLEAAPRPIAW